MITKEYIKKRREELNLKPEDIAEKVGVTPTTVYRWESGEIDVNNINLSKIENLAKVLNCSPAFLMGWEDIVEVKINKKDTAYVGVIKEAAESGLTPDEIREIIELGKKFKGR